MATVNAKLIDINKKIMDANQSIVEFNTQQIATNKALIKGGLKPEKAKPASNAKIIKANRSTMASLEKNFSFEIWRNLSWNLKKNCKSS